MRCGKRCRHRRRRSAPSAPARSGRGWSKPRGRSTTCSPPRPRLRRAASRRARPKNRAAKAKNRVGEEEPVTPVTPAPPSTPAAAEPAGRAAARRARRRRPCASTRRRSSAPVPPAPPGSVFAFGSDQPGSSFLCQFDREAPARLPAAAGHALPARRARGPGQGALRRRARRPDPGGRPLQGASGPLTPAVAPAASSPAPRPARPRPAHRPPLRGEPAGARSSCRSPAGRG